MKAELKKALGPAAELPYDPARTALYTVEELLAPSKQDPQRTTDDAIFDYYAKTGGSDPDAKESLLRRLHDFAIDEALVRCIGRYPKDRLRVVGVMGGHSARRSSADFLLGARVAFEVRRAGFRMVTGGGPGMMESANLGAYLADITEATPGHVEEAVSLLGQAEMPEGKDWHLDPAKKALFEAYVAQARLVRERYPRTLPTEPTMMTNLAVPTWFYGWEPTNLFADGVAKYFANSLREDGLISMCVGGVIYLPGSLGTTQEVFVDAAQNHYGTVKYLSPMVFVGTRRWAVTTLHYQLIQQLSHGKPWNEYVALVDEPEDVAAFLTTTPPVPA